MTYCFWCLVVAFTWLCFFCFNRFCIFLAPSLARQGDFLKKQRHLFSGSEFSPPGGFLFFQTTHRPIPTIKFNPSWSNLRMKGHNLHHKNNFLHFKFQGFTRRRRHPPPPSKRIEVIDKQRDAPTSLLPPAPKWGDCEMVCVVWTRGGGVCARVRSGSREGMGGEACAAPCRLHKRSGMIQ